MNNLEITQHLAKTNTIDYNLLKAAEECNELAEVLLKKVLKRGGPKEPTDQAIIEEIGDVIIRTMILSDLLGVKAVDERIDFKLSKYREYIKDGKYVAQI